jgi:hypothetical protein
VVNRAEPQSKHTKTLGNTKTPGLARCLKPEKWIIISEVNSACLLDLHSAQRIKHPLRCATDRRVKGLPKMVRNPSNLSLLKIAHFRKKLGPGVLLDWRSGIRAQNFVGAFRTAMNHPKT